MLGAEQELPIEITKVNGIQVDNVDLSKASEDQVLE